MGLNPFGKSGAGKKNSSSWLVWLTGVQLDPQLASALGCPTPDGSTSKPVQLFVRHGSALTLEEHPDRLSLRYSPILP